MYNPPNAPYSPHYGAPFTPPSGPPAVWTWFRVYAGLMAVVYLAVAAMGVAFLAGGLSSIPGMTTEGATTLAILGVTYTLMGAVFAGGFGYGIFLPRKPWAWIYGIVLICLGLTSLCCLPATIPLLIFWLKPEAKQFFGRQ